MGLTIGGWIVKWNKKLYFNVDQSVQRGNIHKFGNGRRSVVRRHNWAVDSLRTSIDKDTLRLKSGVLKLLLESKISFSTRLIDENDKEDYYLVEIHVEYANKLVICYIKKENLDKLALIADESDATPKKFEVNTELDELLV